MKTFWKCIKIRRNLEVSILNLKTLKKTFFINRIADVPWWFVRRVPPVWWPSRVLPSPPAATFPSLPRSVPANPRQPTWWSHLPTLMTTASGHSLFPLSSPLFYRFCSYFKAIFILICHKWSDLSQFLVVPFFFSSLPCQTIPGIILPALLYYRNPILKFIPFCLSIWTYKFITSVSSRPFLVTW